MIVVGWTVPVHSLTLALVRIRLVSGTRLLTQGVPGNELGRRKIPPILAETGMVEELAVAQCSLHALTDFGFSFFYGIRETAGEHGRLRTALKSDRSCYAVRRRAGTRFQS